MKPVVIFCLALICFGMVSSVPAPQPLGTLLVPTVVVGTTGTVTAGTAAAYIGAKLLGTAGLLALASRPRQ